MIQQEKVILSEKFILWEKKDSVGKKLSSKKKLSSEKKWSSEKKLSCQKKLCSKIYLVLLKLYPVHFPAFPISGLVLHKLLGNAQLCPSSGQKCPFIYLLSGPGLRAGISSGVFGSSIFGIQKIEEYNLLVIYCGSIGLSVAMWAPKFVGAPT